jgi:prepilin-type N-terminal cleavage/methylation domain-containing protein
MGCSSISQQPQPTALGLPLHIWLWKLNPMPKSCHPLMDKNIESPDARIRRFQPKAFTLIELLIVIAIIAILAGLGFAGVNGALKTARKTEVRAMANQIKLALSAYYAEYGVYPSYTNANSAFLVMMSPANAGAAPTNNRRAIRFLDVPDKFTNATGIVTPRGFYPNNVQSNFNIAVDTNYDGRLDIRLGSGTTNIGGTAAVWVQDPDVANKVIGTW